MFSAFPKIWALGSPQTEGIFDGPIEVTEKIDGSQFAFGYDEQGQFRMRSKGAEVVEGAPNGMFRLAHDWALSVRNRVPMATQFYGEFLQSPKHNILTYGRVPTNNFMLFAACVGGEFVNNHTGLKGWADLLGCEVVPLLFEGTTNKVRADVLASWLEQKSVLGEALIEGVVIKNWNKACEYKGLFLPVTSAKYVSEKFKEVLDKEWRSTYTAKGNLDTLKESYAAPARWEKAVQRLREAGTYQQALQDIGPLMVEARRDIIEEEKERIKNALWGIFGDDIVRYAVKGIPAWYKMKLAEHVLSPSPEGEVTNDQ